MIGMAFSFSWWSIFRIFQTGANRLRMQFLSSLIEPSRGLRPASISMLVVLFALQIGFAENVFASAMSQGSTD